MSQVVFTQSSFDPRVEPSTIVPMHAAEHTHPINAAKRNSRLTAIGASCGGRSGRSIILLTLPVSQGSQDVVVAIGRKFGRQSGRCHSGLTRGVTLRPPQEC